ncbi:hypothetical protein SYK_06900 [Pseudodesulfovibrio nedwellii]|uniref:XRE family transcriptional regulator n=1 Tax=Pseudodesulfovibrio nedwellii TaxID=2973072 RepID=A0ABM8AXU7_9BACT|nr:hypothetical protein [Pseudodesulfovibrio nedwellii]BDQ36330.1 hypothetical protein SYK_06900 [Pseudodesulfovibrio nedwellii]
MITQKELTKFLNETGWNEQQLASFSGLSLMTIRRVAGKVPGRKSGVRTADVQLALEPFIYGDKHPGTKDEAA